MCWASYIETFGAVVFAPISLSIFQDLDHQPHQTDDIEHLDILGSVLFMLLIPQLS